MVDIQQTEQPRNPILWDPVKRALFTDGHPGFVGVLELQIQPVGRGELPVMPVMGGGSEVEVPSPLLFVGFADQPSSMSRWV